MKKLLGVSIVAMLAVTPMMARADLTPATTESSPYAGVDITTIGDNAETKHIASTAYVKGAYNAAIAAVNDLSTKKQNNLMAGANAVSSTVKTSVDSAASASNTALVTEKAVRDAIDAVSSSVSASAGDGLSYDTTTNKFSADLDTAAGLGFDTGANGSKKIQVKTAANKGLTFDNGALAVVVDTATMKLDSDGVGIKDAGVDSAQLADSAVIGDKIAANAVTAAKLDTNAVTTDKILNSNVTTDKLADSAVTTAKILDSNITTGKLADSAVTTAKINAGAVTDAKLADSAVTTAKINAGAVTEDKLDTGAVTETKLGTGAVTETKIADNAVTYAKLGSGFVQSSVRSSVATDADDYDAWNSGQTVASEKAVATAISTATTGMATQSGVVATINSAVPTIQIYDTWNSTSTTPVSGSISVAAYQSSAN